MIPVCIAVMLAAVLYVVKWKRTAAGNDDTLFQMTDPDSTGIHFNNRITTDDSVNIFSFEYIYNGGGVGVGDFNRDGLPDLFFVGSMVPGKLYLNRGKFRFDDVTANSGIVTSGAWPFGVSVIDINQDGWPDIYICRGGPEKKDSIYHNLLFINQGLDKNGNPHFVEMAAAYGLQDAGQSIQAIFFDYDHDGDLDMYLVKGGGFERSPITARPLVNDGTAANTDRLYRNDFNKALGHPLFTDVSRQAGILEEGYGLGVSILDINEDGWPDIYVTDDYMSNDLLYINNRNGTFSERSAAYFKHTSHFAMGNDVGDINNDGLADIMTVDMLPGPHYERMMMFGPNEYDKFQYAVKNGYSYQYMRNTLQLNQGNGRFSEIGQLAGVYKTGWSWSVLMADLDNDEYQDIFITNGFGKDVTDLDFVKFRSNFVRQPGAKEQTKILLDSLSLRPGTKLPNAAFRNNGDLTFRDVTKDWGFGTPTYSNGAAYVDLDNDGDLDLVINNIDNPAHVYRNMSRERAAPGKANYLEIQLKGPAGNSSAIGSRIDIHYDRKTQTRWQSVVRGFESTVWDRPHFGLGDHTGVDTLAVTWPDARQTLLTDIKANQLVTVDYGQGQSTEAPAAGLTTTKPAGQISARSFFTAVSPASLGITYRQNESRFNDFNYEKLLPKKFSMNGPGIAVGDLNGDGLEDFFVGGSFQQAGVIYLQHRDGSFTGHELSPQDDASVDMGCLFFDVDGDGDLDLYVVSGGSDYTRGYKRYQHRLYLNDGKGNFTRDMNALPAKFTSGSCVVAADYDKDGDLDLFVGGRIEPGFYPETPSSTILRNDHGRFTDVTDSIAPGLRNIGMVTSALWTDVDNDGQPDLLLTGEWMPITVFKNEGGKFTNTTVAAGLKNTEGWWQSVVGGDFDNDGDMDYIVGNWGLNCPYQVSAARPMSIRYKDFDRNGSLDAILSYYEDGVDYPAGSWDNMVLQMPFLRKNIPDYHTYALTSMAALLSMLDTARMKRAVCKTLGSVYLENTGNGRFRIHDLPIQAQFSPLLGMMAEDIDHDGNLDWIGVGNFYGTEVVTGRYDASVGLTMMGDGKGHFKPLTTRASGLIANGDAKALVRIASARRGSLLLVSQNADSLQVFDNSKAAGMNSLVPAADETYAIVESKNGLKRKLELAFGSSYLSQSSRSIPLTPDIETVTLYNNKGARTRVIRTGQNH